LSLSKEISDALKSKHEVSKQLEEIADKYGLGPLDNKPAGRPRKHAWKAETSIPENVKKESSQKN